MATPADVKDIKSSTTFLSMQELGGTQSLWNVTYYFLTSGTELSATNGYDIITFIAKSY